MKRIVHCGLWVVALAVSSAYSNGLTGANSQLWHQDVQNGPSETIDGVAAAGDRFGLALAAGDFNNNGYADLAIGVPNDDEGGALNGGAVHVVNGGPPGLVIAGNSMLFQDFAPGLAVEEDDHFGVVLAVGDFNNDGFADLVSGAPEEDIGLLQDAGYLAVAYGSTTGLDPATGQAFAKDSIAGNGIAQNDFFAASLAVGDFNNDDYDDLAAGTPGEDFNTSVDAGSVSVFYGSASGLGPVGIGTANGMTFFQASDFLAFMFIETNDQFGAALAAADFDGDGFDDLAVGSPGESLTAGPDCGLVQVIYGSATGLDLNRRENFYQGEDGVHDTPESGDQFGKSLAAGRLGDDLQDDLIIGVPGEDLAAENCGAVHVLFGLNTGLVGADRYFFHQDTGTLLDQCEAHESFGNRVAIGDFNDDNYGDIAVGYFESTDVLANAGAVHVVYGTATGPQNDGFDQLWTQDANQVVGAAGANELFGYALAVADFNLDGVDDLAVGVPFDVAGQVNDTVGSVNILLGTPALPQRWHQGATPLGQGWSRFNWLGDFAVMPNDWIWHNRHGFMYSASPATHDIWFWTQDMGWLWTGEYTYPFVYRLSDGAWLWYQRPSYQPRWFHNFSNGTWERH